MTLVIAIGAAIVGALHFMVTDGFGMVVVGGFPLRKKQKYGLPALDYHID